MGVSALKLRIETRAKAYHAKTPILSKLPFRAISIIIGVALINVLIWIAIGVVIVRISSKYHRFVAPDRHSIALSSVCTTISIQSSAQKEGATAHILDPRDLAPTAVISYSLGLRHALDADHIAIIDLVTRRLVATGQKPVAVGTFFSLGHST